MNLYYVENVKDQIILDKIQVSVRVEDFLENVESIKIGILIIQVLFKRKGWGKLDMWNAYKGEVLYVGNSK